MATGTEQWILDLKTIRGKSDVRLLAQQIVDSQSWDIWIELMQLPDKQLARRAGWVWEHVVGNFPDAVRRNEPKLLRIMAQTDERAVRRSCLKAFSMSLPSGDQLGELLELSAAEALNRSASLAARVYALEVLFQISGLIPEVRGEFKAILDQCSREHAPSIRSRCKRYEKSMATRWHNQK
ncbi:MAG TPA: hypothetical protein VFV37_07455 [Luteibaculaceae bacterium]|nr:hypothetical protein [Luteibaculaceae bacterium]